MCIKNYLLISLILFYNSFVLCQDTEGFCNCDLTKYCDLLCCCDSNCSLEDLNAFNCKKEEPSSTYCVNELEKELLFSNTLYLFQSIKELVCISKKDNLYISQPNSLNDLTEIELKVKTEKINPSIVQSTLDILDINDRDKEYFTSSDRIWLSYPKNIKTYFKIPIQFGPRCMENLPINYLINQKTSCFSQNNNFSLLNYENIKIIPSPSVLKNCSLQNLTDFHDCDLLIPLTTNTENCFNIADCVNKFPNITTIKFIFEYENPIGITKAYIDFNDIKSNIQNYEVSFVKKDQDSSSSSRKSGNPGYQIGEPIIAGTELNGNITVNPNRDERFAILASSKYCNDTLKTSILFGKNVLSECFLKIDKLPNEICILDFNEYVKDLMLDEYKDLTHVAAYGSMIQTGNLTEGEWIKIETSDLPKPVSSNGTCSNLLNELQIAISFALVGNVDNPQAKILNIKYNWETVKIKLPASNLQVDWLTRIKVTYLDFTLNAQYTQSKLKRSQLKLPSDFFKPLN